MASRSRKAPKYDIRSEFSAQRMSHTPNPAVSWAIAKLLPEGNLGPNLRIADQGCGKLRHFRTLSPIARELILVDTEDQLSRTYRDGDREYTVKQFAQSVSNRRRRVVVMTSDEFSCSQLHLDIVFCIAVFDVVLRPIPGQFNALYMR